MLLGLIIGSFVGFLVGVLTVCLLHTARSEEGPPPPEFIAAMKTIADGFAQSKIDLDKVKKVNKGEEKP